MAIKRNPLNDKKKQRENISSVSAKPAHRVEAFIGQAEAPNPEQVAGAEKIYPWEESGPQVINQNYFQIPLGNNRTFELFWRISRE